MVSRSYFLLCALLAALAVVPGCGPSTESTKPPEGQTPAGSPRELLDRAIAEYAKATSYRDKGTLRLRYQVENESLEQATEVSVDFVRPTKLALRIKRPSMQIQVASDGKQIQAKVTHPETRDFDGQFVSRPVPEELTVGHLYAATEYRDPARPQQMTSLLEGTHINLEELPLALLLAKKPFVHLLGEAKLKFLPDHGHGGKDVRRVSLETPDGDYVFWIDPAKNTLVQIDFPAKKLMEELAASSTGKVQDVTYSLDLAEVELGAKVDDAAFKLDAEGAAPQQHFVYPPPPLPSPLFGKEVGDLELVEITGKPIPAESLKGKITTLLWWQNHESCRLAMEQLELVYQTFNSNPKLAFWAVCTEPSATKPGQIAAMLNHWKVHVPGARDLKATGRDMLGITQAPSLAVIDAEGKMQIFEIGANPKLSQELPIILQRMLDGDKLADEIVRRHEQDRLEYTRSLALARGQEVPPLPGPKLEVPPKSDPQKMRIAPAWTCTEIKEPGNFLVVSQPNSEPAVLVLEGKRTVVQLDAQGKVAGRLPLPIPEGAAVTFLRTGVDAQGKRYYAASAKLGREVYVFDAQWKLLFSYPDPAERHEGIDDVLLADLAGDGDMECHVAFWGLVGTHAVDFKGKRLWSNRTATPALSLTTIAGVAENERQLIVTSDRGLLLPIAAGGREVQALQVGQRAIHQIVAASFPAPRASAYMGLSFTAEGKLSGIALTDSLNEAWEYPLPGDHRTPIEFMTSCNFGIAGGGEWLLAGSDGSVHLVSHNGDFFDSFRTGKVLTGIAGIKSGGKRLVLTASKDGIEAVEIVEAK